MYVAEPSNDPHELFVDQFEWIGGDWLYRWKDVGPGYRVTDDEKDAFVAAFDRAQKRMFWMLLALFVGYGAVLFATPAGHTFERGLGAWNFAVPGSMIVISIVLRIANDWLSFRAPTRALNDRTPTAPARSKAERRRIAAERISTKATIFVGVMGAGILLVATLLLRTSASGWRIEHALFVFGLPALMLVWAIVDGVRKWAVLRPAGRVMPPAI